MTGQVLGVGLSGAVTQFVLARELKARITGPDAPAVSRAAAQRISAHNR